MSHASVMQVLNNTQTCLNVFRISGLYEYYFIFLIDWKRQSVCYEMNYDISFLLQWRHYWVNTSSDWLLFINSISSCSSLFQYFNCLNYWELKWCYTQICFEFFQIHLCFLVFWDQLFFFLCSKLN